MARITVEDCLTHQNNRFGLVLLASKRSKQLLAGSSATTDSQGNKSIVTSLREIAAGHVRFMTPEEEVEFEERLKAQAEADAQRRMEQQSQRTPVAADGGTNGHSAMTELKRINSVASSPSDDDEIDGDDLFIQKKAVVAGDDEIKLDADEKEGDE